MTVFLLLGGVLAVVAIAWALGLFTVQTDGKLEAPSVAVSGGSVPDVAVKTADVEIGTREEVVEVPTVSVTPANEK